ncbi:bifunctional dTDP-4-dehydrorhamnose 3,5-epimerase family protein/NAD(P)-dependent oxidoreductase [Kribbella sp. NPDC005582]|uniref:bifunctional dTDP-4-dehydrorhamnose 3,5-epimerase family protein/NAD(P)-dependent oxidoreductase n=1 Tax=Kribbella sp. NPDC005582 TaxID=3156893 RepID=UPI0033BCE62F
MTEPQVAKTAIPGLLVLRLPVHADSRGWFKENWQRTKMTALGLPDFGPVQNNMSFNAARGVTRGINAEPWDKFVSVATGRMFAAWVDLREGDSFGATVHLEFGPDVAVFVPSGVGNSYQALENGTVFSYLNNGHFVPGRQYQTLNLADETIAIPWPIPLDSDAVVISQKDRDHPRLTDITPVQPKKRLILGRSSQLGRALAAVFPDADAVDRSELDITSEHAVAAWPWSDYAVVLNAGVGVDVDTAELPDGRRKAWAVNASGVARLAAVAREHQLTLVHYSSGYVFDGTTEEHTEGETPSPLGVHGQSVAAGEVAVATVPRHYLLRTSWVIGDGENFVRSMKRLAESGIDAEVVDDQIGRLTCTETLAAATKHLLRSAEYGTYNCTNSGEPLSRHAIAAEIFEQSGRCSGDVRATSTEVYSAANNGVAPRPPRSVLVLDKLRAAGFQPEPQLDVLRRYVADGGRATSSEA